MWNTFRSSDIHWSLARIIHTVATRICELVIINLDSDDVSLAVSSQRLFSINSDTQTKLLPKLNDFSLYIRLFDRTEHLQELFAMLLPQLHITTASDSPLSLCPHGIEWQPIDNVDRESQSIRHVACFGWLFHHSDGRILLVSERQPDCGLKDGACQWYL